MYMRKFLVLMLAVAMVATIVPPASADEGGNPITSNVNVYVTPLMEAIQPIEPVQDCSNPASETERLYCGLRYGVNSTINYLDQHVGPHYEFLVTTTFCTIDYNETRCPED